MHRVEIQSQQRKSKIRFNVWDVRLKPSDREIFINEVGVGVISAVRIQDLKQGEKATVASLIGNEAEIARLAAMGIRGGAAIEILRRGSTCILQVEQSRICLRPNSHTQILVRPV